VKDGKMLVIEKFVAYSCVVRCLFFTTILTFSILTHDQVELWKFFLYQFYVMASMFATATALKGLKNVSDETFF
jgi:hypothetical protein